MTLSITIEQFIEEVKKINPAINCFSAGSYKIEGNYRGKKSERFLFDCSTRSFIYNNANQAVASTFEKVISSFN